jgi:uncharacterized membrane protein
MYWAFLILRYMHILGAIALMGSALFMRFALAPAVQLLPEEQQKNLHQAVRVRWSMFVRGATLLLLVSGVANLGLIPANYSFPDKSINYNMLAGIKFLLALPIFFIAELLLGKSSLAQKIQANRVFWLNVNLVLALVMVLIGGVLRFIDRVPKSAAPNNQTAVRVVEPVR